VLGKIVLFAPGGIAIAMFPKTSELFEVKGKHLDLLFKALLLTLFISGGAVLAYYLYPSFVVNIIFGDKYLFTTPYIARYGLAMAFFALTGLLMNYSLSINRMNIAYFLALTAFLEIVLIAMFHSSIGEVVDVMLACGALSLVSIGIYLRGSR
jgi:O-antigen/teichoic acid export membrane protein